MGIRILMTIAAGSPVGHAMGIVISAAIAVSGLSLMVAGAVTRSGSGSHSVHCMFVCMCALGVSALHVHEIHCSSPVIVYCISTSRHRKTTLTQWKIDQMCLVLVSELSSMRMLKLHCKRVRMKFIVTVEINRYALGLPCLS